MRVLIGSCIFGLCLANVGYGQVISVSFAGDNGGGNTVSIGGIESTPEVAGVVPVANWNSDDFYLDEGFIEDLIDDSGTATSAAVEWAGSANTWGGTGATTEDEMMVNGWLDDNGTGAEVLVTGIPYENYDLYVYGSSDAGNAGRGLTTRVNEVDYFSNGAFVDPISENGSFYTPEVGYVNAATVSDNPTYFKIGGLSGDELSIFGQRNQVGPEVPNGITDFRGGIAGFQIVDCGDVCEVTAVPPASVAGVGIGSQTVSGSPANQVFGPEVEGAGLAQEWFAVANPGDKAALDDVFADNDPAVAAFRAGNGSSWWTGSSTALEGVLNYPAEVQPQMVDNYSVRLTGEIFIPESGFYRFADGVDDFTFLSIDDEVLIEDNTWTGVLRDANGGGGEIGEAEFDVADGGEWLAIEFNAAEGGGGDSGVLYWDYSAEDGVGGGLGFPDFADEAILLEDAVALLVPDSHLRSSVASLISGEIAGTIPASESGWEFEINAAESTADAFELANPNADVFTTMLDVDGAVFILSVDGDVSEGDTFQILIADIITGTPSISPEGWNFDAATGSVVFGNALACLPDSQGDLDGDGNVGFPDFLILSANFGADVTSHTDGDINCDGSVGFPDFLILSANFGSAVGAEAASVPEPAGFALLSFAGLLGGLVRRRRR